MARASVIRNDLPYPKGTTMPQPKRYIGGVRGGPEATMNVVSLELDIGQPHEF